MWPEATRHQGTKALRRPTWRASADVELPRTSSSHFRPLFSSPVHPACLVLVFCSILWPSSHPFRYFNMFIARSEYGKLHLTATHHPRQCGQSNLTCLLLNRPWNQVRTILSLSSSMECLPFISLTMNLPQHLLPRRTFVPGRILSRSYQAGLDSDRCTCGKSRVSGL